MVEASQNGLGSVVDQILLYCYRYNPSLGKYTAVITRVLRLAGLVFCICLAAFLWINWRRDRASDRETLHRQASAQGATSR
jgi:protein SCO1/2